MAENGRPLFEMPPFKLPERVTRSIHLGRELTADSFAVAAPEGTRDGERARVRAIEVLPGKADANEAHVDLPVVDGRLESDLEQDALKSFVFERHRDTGTFG